MLQSAAGFPRACAEANGAKGLPGKRLGLDGAAWLAHGGAVARPTVAAPIGAL